MAHMQRTDGLQRRGTQKRFNVSLNEDLVRVVQSLTDNLSGTVETLLAAYLAEERGSGPGQGVLGWGLSLLERLRREVRPCRRRVQPGLNRRGRRPLMAQFDVHQNQGRTRAAIPYLLTVQSNRIDSRHTTVVIPLVAAEVGSGSELPGHPDRHLNPSLTVEGRRVILHTTRSSPFRPRGSARRPAT